MESIAYIHRHYKYTVDDNMEMDDTFAKEHIHEWTKAWNEHNIKEVLSLYSDNISFSSPKIKSVYPTGLQQQ